MIKLIHYCWFGGNPLPELAVRCIESWKKYCPDYEIIEWNESNFDINCCKYVREAYDAKKWAFVSDFARFKILYEYGGLYFDTDVELIKPIDDIVNRGPFMACEKTISKNNLFHIGVAPGLGLYATAGLEIYNELLNSYYDRSFLDEDGNYNLTTIVDYTTGKLIEKGLKPENVIQFVSGIYIYPDEFFCPFDYTTGEMHITTNTRSIHHYDGSWRSERQSYADKLRLKLVQVLPVKLAAQVAYAISVLKYEGVCALVSKIKHKLS